MRTLSDHIGRVELHENIRQQDAWERATLQLLRDGEARAAYREYERYDRIHDAHSVAERRVQVIEDHARLEAGGLDTVILARRRDEVAALNELAHARSVGRGRVHGPALTVGDKEYQVGDRVICLANERSGAVSNGTRGVVTAVDVERQTLTLERPDKRQLTLDTTHYDAIDRGYALTVHKAQGMTADIALVVGSEGATREWAYTAMSRATLATHYYEVSTRPSGTPSASSTGRKRSRSAEERTVQAWTRSELKESALDYPERYRETDRDHNVPAPDVYAPATEARGALADLGAPEPGAHATRLEAAVAIERWSEQTPGMGLDQWLRETNAAEARLDQLLSDIGGARPDGLELGTSVAGDEPGQLRGHEDAARSLPRASRGRDARARHRAGARAVRPKSTSTAGRIAALTKWAAQLDVGLASVAAEVAELRARLDDPQHAAVSPTDVSGGTAENAQSSETFVSLLDWVNWMARAFALSERFPSCWYKHEGVVVSLRALRHWHSALQRGASSDPSSTILWVDAVYRINDRMLRPVAQHCLSTHRDAPELDSPTEDELTLLNQSWPSRR